MTNVFLPAGTKVVCQAGHHVCDVIADLHKGEEKYAQCIGNWQDGQHVPKTGDNLPLMCWCGQPYTGFFPQFPWTEPPNEEHEAT